MKEIIAVDLDGVVRSNPDRTKHALKDVTGIEDTEELERMAKDFWHGERDIEGWNEEKERRFYELFYSGRYIHLSIPVSGSSNALRQLYKTN